MFFASDEMYLVAGREVPPSGHYEHFDQHENGIGMIRAFYDELEAVESGRNQGAPVTTGAWNALPAAPAEGYRAPRGGYVSDGTAGEGPVVIVTGDVRRQGLRPHPVPAREGHRGTTAGARSGQRVLRR